LDQAPVTGFESDKVRALLAYLAIEAGRVHARDVLAGLLWPNRPNRDALSNLRYALYDLRNVLGDRSAEPPFLLVTRRTLRFNRESDHRLDVATFETCTDDPTLSTLQSAVALYRGPFLDGFSLADCPAFEEWALLKREHLNHRMVSALGRLAVCYEQASDYQRALQSVRRQLELEPWDERAHRQLMRLLDLAGRRNAALAHYEACRRLLNQELDVEPAPATTALYERIRTCDVQKRSPAPRIRTRTPLPRPAPPFVAREEELARLNRFLKAALAGQGRVAFITGEAGSGKTALAHAFARQAMATHGDLIVASGQCSARSGIGDPYLPFREILQMLAGDVEARRAGGTLSRTHVDRLWAMLPAVARSLAEQGPDLLGRWMPGEDLALRVEGSGAPRATWTTRLRELGQRDTAPPVPREALFEQLTRVLKHLSDHAPLLLILDDLQWADSGSMNLLFHLGQRLAGGRLLLIGAYRSGEVSSQHALTGLVNEFQRRQGESRVDLDRAEGRHFVEALLDSEPNHLDKAFRETLYRHTAGNPLFTIELLCGLQERGELVQDAAGHWVEGAPLDWKRMPARVEAVIAQRLNRLTPGCRTLLAVASVEGETFTAEVVARVLDLDEADVVRRLSGPLCTRRRLVHAHSLQHLGPSRLSRYRFRHALFREYLYQSLDPVERARHHQGVAEALVGLHQANQDQAAARIAHHFEAAGMVEPAADYLFRAGKQAVRLSAHQEAINHYTRGIELLRTQPDSPARARRELALQLALGTPLQALKSYGTPERGRAYARAFELCQQIGDKPALFQTLFSQWSFDMPRAEHCKALEQAEQLVALAELMQDPAQLAVAHAALGLSLLYLGEFTSAQVYIDQALGGYDPQQHHSLALPVGQNLKVSCLAYSSWSLWLLGYPDQALRRAEGAISMARELGHPYSLGFALGIAGCVVHLRRGQYDAALEEAETLLQLWEEQGFALYRAWGLCVKGRVLSEQGQEKQIAEGLDMLRAGVAACRAVGIAASHTQQLANLAKACQSAGEIQEGLDVVAEALALLEKTGERHFEAELRRLGGELLLAQGGDEPGAAACFQRAIDVARRQRAKSWELRAVTSLSRLWRRQGRQEEAQELLTGIYQWFSEGFDTDDLRQARALLPSDRSSRLSCSNSAGQLPGPQPLFRPTDRWSPPRDSHPRRV
jgi:DNA-binding SARP family transcriptional activator/predicted ATPase